MEPRFFTMCATREDTYLYEDIWDTFLIWSKFYYAFLCLFMYFSFIDYMKTFDCMAHNKLWKILKEIGIPGHLPALWETCMQVRKQQLQLDMEQQTGSK